MFFSILPRIFLLILIMGGMFSVSWFVVAALIFYGVAKYNYFFEAVLIGVLMDILSGMPFGFFTLMFFIVIIASEIIRPTFQESSVTGFFAIALFCIILFLILNIIFIPLFVSMGWENYLNFSKDLFRNIIISGVVLLCVSIIDFIIHAIIQKQKFFKPRY